MGTFHDIAVRRLALWNGDMAALDGIVVDGDLIALRWRVPEKTLVMRAELQAW